MPQSPSNTVRTQRFVSKLNEGVSSRATERLKRVKWYNINCTQSVAACVCVCLRAFTKTMVKQSRKESGIFPLRSLRRMDHINHQRHHNRHSIIQKRKMREKRERVRSVRRTTYPFVRTHTHTSLSVLRSALMQKLQNWSKTIKWITPLFDSLWPVRCVCCMHQTVSSFSLFHSNYMISISNEIISIPRTNCVATQNLFLHKIAQKRHSINWF